MTRHIPFALAFILSGLLACSSDGSDNDDDTVADDDDVTVNDDDSSDDDDDLTDDDDDSSDDDDSTSNDDDAAPAAPVITSVAVDPNPVHAGEIFTVRLEVDDPDGDPATVSIAVEGPQDTLTHNGTFDPLLDGRYAADLVWPLTLAPGTSQILVDAFDASGLAAETYGISLEILAPESFILLDPFTVFEGIGNTFFIRSNIYNNSAYTLNRVIFRFQWFDEGGQPLDIEREAEIPTAGWKIKPGEAWYFETYAQITFYYGYWMLYWFEVEFEDGTTAELAKQVWDFE